MSELWRLPPVRPARDAIDAWIPMADGARLSARLWLPAGDEPCPAVLEYIPYRKQDAYRFHDDVWGPTLAGYGIAYARVDVRGSGDSEGVLTDEYSPIELEDGCAIIAWLAAQPWCSGKVGMRGMSWGGINTLQIAAMRPPALAAIMPMGCLDNRYTDDAHYIGGALGHTNFQWGIGFKTVMAAPPDPLIVGEACEAMWRERLEATPPILATWLEHQTYDDYWKRGSIAEDWSAIEVPTYIVAGWQDTYANPVSRLLENLQVPRKALIGPWGHTYPWAAQPQGLDWAFEEVRWWEHWLKGVPTGIMDEPMLRAFMPHRAPSEMLPEAVPGRWIAETAWPPAASDASYYLTAGLLSPEPGPAATAACVGDRIVGLTKPEWLDRPPIDQSLDDARSLLFRTMPLTQDVEILGAPVLSVRLSSDCPVAKLAARLVEITPEGKSWLVTYGLLNLTHRESHQHPSPLEPGRAYDVEIPLNFTSHRFAAGSRIRAAISESLWPLVWPSPQVATLTLDLGASRLELPVRDPPAREAAMPIPLAAPLPSDPKGWPKMETNEAGDEVRVTETWPVSSSEITEIGETKSGSGPNVVLRMTKGDPLSCVWKAEQSAGFARPGWVVSVKSEITISATATDFHVDERLVATLNGEVVADAPHTSVVRRAAT
jgi:uncharacterized protein